MNKIKVVTIVVLVALIALFATGCTDRYTEADKVNKNISRKADYFECERKITVYNARTDSIIFEAEGYMSLSNNYSNELVITIKTGENTYKKNYVYLNEFTLYAVEDITGTHTDPYHYTWTWHTEFPVRFEVRP